MQSRWQAAEFAKLFQRLLDAAGVSQAEIARRAGVSKGQISRWKNGESRPEYDLIEAVGDVLQKLVPAEPDVTARLLALAGYGAHFGSLPEAVRPGRGRRQA